MNGSHPAVNEGAVARTICFHWSNNTCNWSEPAMVRNCGSFYVYFPRNVSWGRNGRYCGTIRIAPTAAARRPRPPTRARPIRRVPGRPAGVSPIVSIRAPARAGAPSRPPARHR